MRRGYNNFGKRLVLRPAPFHISRFTLIMPKNSLHHQTALVLPPLQRIKDDKVPTLKSSTLVIQKGRLSSSSLCPIWYSFIPLRDSRRRTLRRSQLLRPNRSTMHCRYRAKCQSWRRKCTLKCQMFTRNGPTTRRK